MYFLIKKVILNSEKKKFIPLQYQIINKRNMNYKINSLYLKVF